MYRHKDAESYEKQVASILMQLELKRVQLKLTFVRIVFAFVQVAQDLILSAC